MPRTDRQLDTERPDRSHERKQAREKGKQRQEPAPADRSADQDKKDSAS